ncbi:MAG: DUF2155 domain-containing protein [Pseudomonadota bacterium]
MAASRTAIAAVLAIALAGSTGAAQQSGQIETVPLDPVEPGSERIPLEGNVEVVEPEVQTLPVLVRVRNGPSAILRGLDKISGATSDLTVPAGGRVQYGRLSVEVGECRYPADNPSGDAFAWVEISEDGAEERLFRGWMIASSPALSALDHPRYDVWVIRCNIS